jgi:hypothetical protein
VTLESHHSLYLPEERTLQTQWNDRGTNAYRIRQEGGPSYPMLPGSEFSFAELSDRPPTASRSDLIHVKNLDGQLRRRKPAGAEPPRSRVVRRGRRWPGLQPRLQHRPTTAASTVPSHPYSVPGQLEVAAQPASRNVCLPRARPQLAASRVLLSSWDEQQHLPFARLPA